MNIKIVYEKENPLFERKEIRFEVNHENEPTPKLSDVKTALATKIGVNPSLIIIDSFKTMFGVGISIGDARIYKDIEKLKQYEPEYLLKRNKVIKEEKENGQKEEEGST